MDAPSNLIVIKCPNCGLRLSFKPVPNYREKPVKCPKCAYSNTAGNFELVSDPSQRPIDNDDADTRLTGAPATIECIETGESYSLKEGRNTIGRRVAVPKASIVFTDPDRYMSKLHAVIKVVRTGGQIQLHLSDEDSTNGTFINNKQVPRGSIVLLNPGVKFNMGELTFVCNVRSGARSSRYEDGDTQM